MKLRVILAVAACKCVRFAARVLHRGGTAKPGEIALKICPDLLSVVSRGVQTIVVTGTNGKTTSCRMLEQAFAEAGLDCITNRSGANLMSGIVTEFVMCSSLTGKCRRQYAVMECDEGWTRRVLPAMHPRAFLVTNLFRDQVDRYGDVSNTLAAIREGVAGSPETTLVLNADDHISAALAADVPNPVIWYGIDAGAGTRDAVPAHTEVTACQSCGAALDYDYVNYAHLGGWRCPGCGRARPATDVGVAELLSLGLDGSRVRMHLLGGTSEVTVSLPALYNISNAAGTIAGALAMGLTASAGEAAVKHFRPGFGRMERFEIGKAGARMVLVKNAAGCDQVLTLLRAQTEPFRLVFITNNRPADGTDVSWLSDTAFELLAGMQPLQDITLSGLCAEIVRECLLAAGVPADKLRMEPDYDALTAFLAASDIPVFLLPSYTGMMEFRPYLVRHCGGADFWE
jgi:UDP-N-acetylmuramyl tripeptide synthase